MEIEKAKQIHSLVMKIAFAVEGIGEYTAEDLEEYKKLSLLQACQANNMLNDHKEPTENGGTEHWVTADETALADLYLRVHSVEYIACDELNSAVEALDDESDSEWRVILDGWGYTLEKNCEEVTNSKSALDIKKAIGKKFAELVTE